MMFEEIREEILQNLLNHTDDEQYVVMAGALLLSACLCDDGEYDLIPDVINHACNACEARQRETSQLPGVPLSDLIAREFEELDKNPGPRKFRRKNHDGQNSMQRMRRNFSQR